MMVWASNPTQKIEVGNWGPQSLRCIREPGIPYLWLMQGAEGWEEAKWQTRSFIRRVWATLEGQIHNEQGGLETRSEGSS